MAAELENAFGESSELIQSSGGVFDVEDRSTLIYSKKVVNRFPEEGEVTAIVNGVGSGMSLEEAKTKAADGAPQPPGFVDWFKTAFRFKF